MKILNFIKIFLKYRQPIKVAVNNVTVSPNELLKGKNAVITGGSGGIGSAIAFAFEKAGANVVIIGRNKHKLDAVCGKSERIHSIVCDINNVELIQENLQLILTQFDSRKIDIIINCAGITGIGNSDKFFDVTPDDFDKVMNTNCRAMFFWCQAVAKHMIENEINGRICNVTSIMGQVGDAAPYGISKWAANGLTKGLARILAPKGIVINGIAPGLTNTPMLSSNILDSKESPNLRRSLPEEIANLAVFLVSDLASNIVGHIVVCDGGETLQYGNDKIQVMPELNW